MSARDGAAGAPAAAAPVEPVEVASGVWALGGTIPIDGRVPWLPEEAVGHESCLAYLIHQGDASLLVDTGLTVHGSWLTAQLHALLPPQGTFNMLVTRIEMDAVGNVGAILDDERLAPSVLCGFAVDPTEFFYRHADAPRKIFRRMRLGSRLDLLPGRPLELLPAPLGNLATAWPFDPTTGTLFTSDSFGWVHPGRPGESPLLRATPPDVDLPWVRAHLLARFDWLAAARIELVVRALDRVFAEHPVQVIAPAHGCVLAGAAPVRRQYELARAALLSIGEDQGSGAAAAG